MDSELSYCRATHSPSPGILVAELKSSAGTDSPRGDCHSSRSFLERGCVASQRGDWGERQSGEADRSAYLNRASFRAFTADSPSTKGRHRIVRYWLRRKHDFSLQPRELDDPILVQRSSVFDVWK